jgi:hypothetical protein
MIPLPCQVLKLHSLLWQILLLSLGMQTIRSNVKFGCDVDIMALGLICVNMAPLGNSVVQKGIVPFLTLHFCCCCMYPPYIPGSVATHRKAAMRKDNIALPC